VCSRTSSMTTYGIDVNPLTRTNRTGTEWYLFYLISNLIKLPLQEGERVLLYSSAVVPEFAELPTGFEWRILNWPFKKGWTKARLSFELLTRSPDVFFSPAHEVPFFSNKTKIVATVHDVAFHLKPEVYSEEEKIRQEKAIARQIKSSDQLIAVSNATKNDLLKIYKVAETKIDVVPLSADLSRFMAHADGLTETLFHYELNQGEYFFYLGRLEAKKNIANLIRAFSKYAENGKADLVLGGKYGFGAEDIKRAINSSKFKNRIKLLGYVRDADVPALMAGALAYVLPSWCEGFGLSALETMASGTPLLASSIPALHEVVEDAGLFADPGDIDAWAENMRLISDDDKLRGELVLRGSARVHDFSWEETARLTFEILRRILAYEEFNK